MGAPGAASEIFKLFVIHMQKMAYNGFKKSNSQYNIFDYELKH
jgi:hypothetical protein